MFCHRYLHHQSNVCTPQISVAGTLALLRHSYQYSSGQKQDYCNVGILIEDTNILREEGDEDAGNLRYSQQIEHRPI